ncbi:MAG: CDP-glycerol glycerophosphotransferase family protein [Kineosporiaceae bacterium]|nr:CDP-glycerol glycerophosphotransferase family protein [Kineosporiaceae bacterium]
MTSASLRPRVVVCLPADDPARGRTVLAGALCLFGSGVEVALCLAGVDRPTEQHADAVLALCRDLAPGDGALPDIVLLGETELRAAEHLLMVEATDDPRQGARAIALMSLAAERLWDGAPRKVTDQDAERAAVGGALRATVAHMTAKRDAVRRVDVPPLVVALVQVQSTWPSIAEVCSRLAVRAEAGEIGFEIVAFDSEHDPRPISTADFVRSQGFAPRDLAWFTAQVDDERSALALVLTDSPWDGLRPEATHALHLAERGVRLAYLPYGNNVGGGAKMMAMAYDLPLHRLAWRAFARSQTQLGLWRTHCSVGADHVRVVGLPKLDRMLALADGDADPGSPNVNRRGAGHPVRELAGDRPVVLWNPHFTLGPDGWSTLDRYLGPLTDWAATHPGVVLMIRPHFRLLRDLPLLGEAGQALLAALHAAADTHPNIVLDTETDYLPAFTVADAMISDISSLITEWLPTRRPICYLHRLDGPGANADAEYLFSLDVATSWAGVREFLDTLAAGHDPGRDRRDLVLSRHFECLDGQSSARIAAELVDGLRAELGPMHDKAPDAVPAGMGTR